MLKGWKNEDGTRLKGHGAREMERKRKKQKQPRKRDEKQNKAAFGCAATRWRAKEVTR
jgi:hypothetical protein